MSQADATLLAAIIAAVVASLGLIWSLVSFYLNRKETRTNSARHHWQRRFEKAHDLALSSDMREAKSGVLLIQSLSREKWVNDEDKATAVSVLWSLQGNPASQDGDLVRKVRDDLITGMSDQKAATELAQAKPGPRGRYEVYPGLDGKYYWRLKSSSGDVVAVAAEGHTSKASALTMIDNLRRSLGGGLVDGADDN